jgi:hypothetical protein
MVDVDGSTIFKTFYEVVRVKVACKDINKIPKDRLYEMNKDFFVVSFDVEGVKAANPRQPGNDDGGGNDDDKKNDKGEEDDDDDLLDDDNDLAKDKMLEDKERTPANGNGQGSASRTRTVNLGISHSNPWEQEKQLITCMSGVGVKLLIAKEQGTLDQLSTNDGGRGIVNDDLKGKSIISSSNDIPLIIDGGSLYDGLNQASSSLVSEKPSIAIGLTEWPFQTPKASQCQNSDCQIVGNKFYQLISEESHHSKWEEFRRGALSDSMNEDCANLLRRMELEESDSEVDTVKS